VRQRFLSVVPFRLGLVSFGLMVAACAASDASQKPGAAHDAACASQVIIVFAQAQAATPDPGLVAQIAQAASVQLSYVRTAGPGLYVFSMSAADADSSCKDALHRLRQDARVRSVDVDARRRALD